MENVRDYYFTVSYIILSQTSSISHTTYLTESQTYVTIIPGDADQVARFCAADNTAVNESVVNDRISFPVDSILECAKNCSDSVVGKCKEFCFGFDETRAQ